LQSRSYIFLLIVLGLAALSGWIFSREQVKYGLDVQGGVRFTYEMDLSSLTQDQRQSLDLVRANTIRIMNSRVSSALGVVEGTVQPKGLDQIIVELPGETDIAKARGVLSTTASIEFYWAKTVATRTAGFRKYTGGEIGTYNGSPGIYFSLRANAEKLIEPGAPEYLEMIRSWGEPILQGGDLKRASAQQVGGGYQPYMEFTAEGARKLKSWSQRVLNRGEHLAAVLDNVVISIAPVKDGVVLSDNAIIDGTFDTGYVKTLVDLLNAGALPVTLKEIQSEKVDPTIGKQALSMIYQAGTWAFGFTIAFLLIYYVFPGFVAMLALALYALFTITALKLIGATFSLAAIAGFILSVGMAVDANILVFERLKEELRGGKTLAAAIELGFKRALPAIVDSNACTILTSLVLMILGTGPVKGFATTLIIGVAISLFTAVTITRSLLKFFVGSGLGANEKWYGLSRQWFGEKLEAEADRRQMPIVQKRNVFFLISGLVILPGLIAVGMGGIKRNVEFLGGYEVSVRMGDRQETTAQLVANLEKAGISGGNVKLAGEGSNRLAYITVGEVKGTDDVEAAKIKIAEAAGFTAGDVAGGQNVGPTIQQEMVRNAILGVIISSILIVLYLAIRFGFALGGFPVGLRFSFAVIMALLHDVLLVVGLAAIFGFALGWEISGLFVTAMLTVIGFSTHDSIVIFDRIRENLRRHIPGEDIGTLINRSVTQSIARSINTSGVVIVSLILLIAIGSATPDLKFFNTVMLCGIVAGTYSSIWNAAPILYVLDRWFAKSRGEHATLLGITAQELKAQRILSQTARPAGQASEPTEDTGYGQVRRRKAKPTGEQEIED